MSALHSGHLGRSTSFSEVGAIDLNRPRWRTARSVGGSGEPPLPASEKLQREQRVTKMSPCICTIFSFGEPARACRSSTFCVTSRNSCACCASFAIALCAGFGCALRIRWRRSRYQDRKSTRLNSSHVKISYAVFCLKKKNKKNNNYKIKNKKNEK